MNSVGDHYEITFRMSDKLGPLSVALRLPKPDDRDVYEIEGVSKVIIYEGRKGTNFAKEPNKASSIWVRTKKEIIEDLIKRALSTALVSSTKGKPPAEQAGQDVIDKFFATSPLLRQVDPDKPLDLELARDCIHIDVAGNSLDVEDRRIHDWPGIVDPLTIPQGDRALQTFRLAEGAKVKDGRIQRGGSIMCGTMLRNLVFPENDRPVRLLLTRSAIGTHEEVVDCEDPIVRHVEYREGDLKGKHLLTAIMADRYNYSDCITISQSAAQKLACYRRKAQTIVDVHDVELLVGTGSIVQPDHVVALIDEGLDHKGKPKVREVRAHNLKSKAQVVSISRTPTHMLGEPAQRIRIRYESVYMLENGDKLTTRHGNKGVVRILPDSKMPELEIRPGHWERAEVLVNPFSLISRRPHGMLREMAVNKMGMPVRVAHFDNKYSIKELSKLKTSKKVPVRMGGRTLMFETFAGPLYWLRLAHHAREKLSAVGSTKPLNYHGLNPDSGKASGQRVNLGMATIMHAKGLEQTHKVLHENNIEKGAITMAEDLMSVLAFKGQRKKIRRRHRREKTDV